VGRDNDAAEVPRAGAVPVSAQNGTMPTMVVTPSGGGAFWKHEAIVSKAEVPDIKIDKEAAQLRLYSRVDVLNDIKVRQGNGGTRGAAIWTTELPVLYWPDEVDLPELKLQVQGIKEQITSAAAGPY
jgi:hypothetical protein